MPETAPLRPPSTKPEPAMAFSGETETGRRRKMRRRQQCTRATIAPPVALGLTAIAAGLASIAAAPGAPGVLGAGLALIMLAIAVIDARHFIIPNGLVAAGFGLGLVHAGIAGSPGVLEGVALATLLGAFLAAVFLPPYALAIGTFVAARASAWGISSSRLSPVPGSIGRRLRSP